MKFKLSDILIDSEKGNDYRLVSHVRIVLLAGIFMYSIFGILDFFMLPENHFIAWIIRFAIVVPLSFIFVLCSYSKRFWEYGKISLTIVAVTAQIGIVIMIYKANPGEGAYGGYYSGLIIVNLWAVLMLRLTVLEIFFISITTVIYYNIVAMGVQHLHRFPYNSDQYGYFLSNNFFLISSSLLSVVGAFQLNMYKRKILDHNLLLSHEKQELYKAKEKAEESERLKSAFLANMSHEIRTPMNAILGFTELLKNSSLPENKRAEYINVLQSKGTQLLRLIDDIIDISKIETNNMVISHEPVNINELFAELKTIYEKILLKDGRNESLKLHFIVAFRNEESWIIADGTRLKQILSNLLDNAIKYTSQGEIHISYIRVENELLQFCVKDTGIGIPADNVPIIFERFRRVDNHMSHSKTGTGLGLSIVKSLVELAGGKIWVKTELHEGSKFYFTLPYRPVNRDGKKNIDLTYYLNNVNWQGKTVLIAEDDKDNYLVLREFLAETGVNILWARNGKDALEIALGDQKIDLILMDIKMPGLNGYQVTQEIKKVRNNIPVIAQTAYAMAEDRKKAMDAKCDAYISKPIDYNQFIVLVDKYLS